MGNNIKNNLKDLNSTDIYSLLLFALYKLKDVPEYSTLSNLAYILDKSTLEKFLRHFGGTTISVPHMRDLKLIANCLLLYELVNIEGNELNKSIDSLKINTEYNLAEIKKIYFSLCKVLSNYTFKGSDE